MSYHHQSPKPRSLKPPPNAERNKKGKEIFWFLPRASKAHAAEAQRSFVKILRILSEIHSNFVQYTPPEFLAFFNSTATMPERFVASQEWLVPPFLEERAGRKWG
ncbi:hypothetical protein HY412_01825 [Candidatus Kaiserbacteria bacterium]|nr:hypothetical protein [Candidatus Kaiserbacteria bacterium]